MQSAATLDPAAFFKREAGPEQIRLQLAAPVFELRGGAGSIDLSAWVSGAAFFSGLLLAQSPTMTADIFSAGSGTCVIASAVVFFLVAVLAIQRHMRLSLLADTFGSPRRLVTSGIFACSRNPIYVAFFVPLASIAVFSLAAAIAAIALYVLAMNLTVIRKEERELLAAFGSDYARYLASAPRWIV